MCIILSYIDRIYDKIIYGTWLHNKYLGNHSFIEIQRSNL